MDPSTRVTKASRPNPPKPTKNSSARYLTQDEQARKFVADEDKFVLKQAKKKADIRVREGRAKPIDYLAFSLRYIDTERDVFDDDEADLDIEVPSPDKIVQDLSTSQLTELESDIDSYHVLETDARIREYWRALQSLCATQKAKLSPQKNEERVVNSVAEDIDKILAPKSYEQLGALETQIRAKLQSTEDIDTDYWEQLLRSLAVWKAKATLKKVYGAITEARRKQLEERGHVPGSKPPPASTDAAAATTPSGDVAKSAPQLSSSTREGPPPGTARFSEVDDGDFSQANNEMFDREIARGVSENEEVFAAEEAVPSVSKPQWADKYRPRKPRYFNRVQMGYEWNKYNQTHYDHDNPPPKVVQGYKFNIFYPELIDKTKAPTFKIIREHGRRRGESFAAAGEEDTCLIRFIAGPPYEDIAFRIVDREWDYSAKRERGFKSSFDKVLPKDKALNSFALPGTGSPRSKRQ
ncbi:hypothetical protein ACRE_058930 [Hapsidospora chrysogenum ATCC 11550]|uniref:Splicing factor Cactin n=1 Tax=Hapsidospora chrysogenum (strain ATCC 11550 / CBS 779.69 / DSM 880 / IAM 14645 / JCM 23072 / IMI 49137) TaxID=857340 RepID=A0A086T1V5_HAPC1|nr:hypothetical protein ACRE_058930 [Hapsidospora chrysogenum ATCC 11550]